MKKHSKSRFAGALAMMLWAQNVHAEIDPIVLANTVDAFKVIRAITSQVRTTSTSKINADSLNPTAEQRVNIVNALARASVTDHDLLQKMIISAQSPIQRVLEVASCAETNRMTSADASPFDIYFSFSDSKPLRQTTIVNHCADAVRVDQWKMPTPEALEFTATFRLLQSAQVNTWRFKMKRQLSGMWELEYRENISFKN
jgi:hypothetical protein